MSLIPVPLAHSARLNKGIQAQSYFEHITNVTNGSVERASEAARYSPKHGSLLVGSVRLGSEFHDLGKLDSRNQRVLASSSQKKLNPRHEDAGVAHLLGERSDHADRELAACLIYSHHKGLPSFPTEDKRGENVFRDNQQGPDGGELKAYTDSKLYNYINLHNTVISGLPEIIPAPFTQGISQILCRIALSCLVDADHSDTARHYGKDQPRDVLPLQANERLEQLDRYVAKLSRDKSDERTRLRQAIYAECRGADPTSSPLWECDSPVGTGKTTAVMAHLLRAAATRQPGLRRLFVVLPFTNIIDQAVEVYRQALVLPGEDPETVVAAHHHKAEYESLTSRHLAAMWRAPIVVTTAVQFFETLAASSTAGLRKLHEVVGSGIFIDESHAALPVKLWPQAWRWIRKLANEWGCHFVLGSGSLNRVWTIREICKSTQTLPPLVASSASTRAADADRKRVRLERHHESMTLEELVERLDDIEGPRLVIVNTVQIAAALANLLRNTRGAEAVMHLSTALTPYDRRLTLERVKARLNCRTDSNWTLVATSCVEAGVDFSFRNGLRQRASLTSLLQILGRVNRHGEFDSATVWDFELKRGGLVNSNPGLDDAARVLGELWAEGKVDPKYCTEALVREIRSGRQAELHEKLDKAESNGDFPAVEEMFRVIGRKTLTVVVSKSIQARIRDDEAVDWREIQQHSVQLYADRVEWLGLQDDSKYPGVYFWNHEYDEFLGYMAGVLPLIQGASDGGFIL